MKRVFADTFFFLAYLSRRDSAHEKSARFLGQFDGELITTEAVLTEVADGMAGPDQRAVFIEFYEAIKEASEVRIVPSHSKLFAEGMALYRERLDKQWSLTDCISMVVMKREKLRDCLTGDHHFEQAGFNALLK